MGAARRAAPIPADFLLIFDDIRALPSDYRPADGDLPFFGRRPRYPDLERLKKLGNLPCLSIVPMPQEEDLLSIADADGRLGVFLFLPFLFLCSDRDCGAGQDKAATKLWLRHGGCRRGRRIYGAHIVTCLIVTG